MPVAALVCCTPGLAALTASMLLLAALRVLVVLLRRLMDEAARLPRIVWALLVLLSLLMLLERLLLAAVDAEKVLATLPSGDGVELKNVVDRLPHFAFVGAVGTAAGEEDALPWAVVLAPFFELGGVAAIAPPQAGDLLATIGLCTSRVLICLCAPTGRYAKSVKIELRLLVLRPGSRHCVGWLPG